MTSAMMIGVGARALAGVPVPSLFRSRGRPRTNRRAGAPKRSGNWHDDDAALSLAICIRVLDQAVPINDAATRAVLIRAGFEQPTQAAFNAALDGRTIESASTHSLVRKRVRRVRDKLYAYEKSGELAEHLEWLRRYPMLREGQAAFLDAAIAKGNRARLFGKGVAALRS